jgi:hypothetical protein
MKIEFGCGAIPGSKQIKSGTIDSCVLPNGPRQWNDENQSNNCIRGLPFVF